MKICKHPGCRSLVKSGYCQAHTKPTRIRTGRDSFLDSRAWRKLSTRKLQSTPWCEYCEEAGRGQTTPALDADHVIPRHERPDLALVESNLKSACKRCHGQKTAKGL